MIILGFLLVILVLVNPMRVQAAYGINRTINFQGKLVNASGVNVPNSTPVTVTFSIYQANSSCPGGGSSVWSENQTFTPVDGIFQVALGSSTAFASSIDFSQDTLYLGIKISTETNEMCMGSSRIKLAAVPYAFNAEKFAGMSGDNSQTNYFTVTGGQGTTATLKVDGNITVGSIITPTSAGGLTVRSNGANTMTLDTGTAAALNIGATSNAITIGNTTGANAVAILTGSGGLIITSASSNGLTVGANGATNPVLQVDNSTGSVATGLKITGSAAGGGTILAAISSGTNENMTIDAKGSGTVTLNGTGTGGIILGRATSISAGGLNVTGQTVLGARNNPQTLTSSQTVTDSTAANVFYLSNDIGTASGATVAITFNLTGVTGTDGTILFLAVQAIKDASVSSSTSSVNVTINGGANVFTTDVSTGTTTNAVTSMKNVILARINGAWKNVATETTSDQAADLAEYYYTRDESIEPGHLVALAENEADTAVVRKTNQGYDRNVIGVVSSQPGLLLGAAVGPARAVPVALSGRVPVQVTAQNGAIKTGDVLTASDIPGIAMKATKVGPMIGVAMQNYSGSEPGLITVFVGTGYFTGGSSSSQLTDMNYLLATKPEITSVAGLSELAADRIVAGLEVVTPTVYAEQIFADKINAREITGLDKMIASESARIIAGLVPTITPTLTPTPSLDMKVLGDLLAMQGLTVSGSAVFGDSVEFKKAPEFPTETAGYAVIHQDTDRVEIVFDNEYISPPIVLIDTQNISRKYQVFLTNKTNRGFMIELDKKAEEELQITWMAITVVNPKTFMSVLPTPMPTLIPTPTEEATASGNLGP